MLRYLRNHRIETMRYLLTTLLLLLTTASWAADDKPRVILETNKGNIVLELYPDKAPKTVANFLQYVQEGYYANTKIGRAHV